MTRDEVKAAFQEKARRTTPIEIEGIGKVYIRKLKLKDQRALSKQEGEEDGRYAARLAACVICDETGAQIFDPADEVDVQTLMDTEIGDLGAINAVNAPPTSGN